MRDSELSRENASIQRIGCAAWRLFLLLVWAAWWGGLCFYAVVVVPIGTELIGSVEQGLITQRVTQWHNGLSGLFLLCVLAEAFRTRRTALWAFAAALSIVDIALFLWHSRLTAMIDFQHRTVSSNFYAEHAVYLWITAAEWALGIVIPIWLLPTTVEGSRRKMGRSSLCASRQ